MNLDGVRVEGFFHVEHPAFAARLHEELEICRIALEFFHAAREILQEPANRGQARDQFHKRLRAVLYQRELVDNVLRVGIEIGRNPVPVNQVALAHLLLRKLLADLHEEAVDCLLRLADIGRKLRALAARRLVLDRDAVLEFGYNPARSTLRGHERLRHVPETEERYSTAKTLVAQFRQAVRLIKDYVLVCGEQREIQGEVGKEQRVVHQQQVGCHRLALRLEGGANRMVLARFSHARCGRTRKLGPQHAIARATERITFPDIALLGRDRPREQRHEGVALFRQQERRRSVQNFHQLADAQVVVAALEHARLELAIVQRGNLRDIVPDKLFLQGMRCGTDHHALARDRLVRRRHQVGKRLARTCRRLKHADAALVQVAFHARGELLLVGARLEILHRLREEPALLEEGIYTRGLRGGERTRGGIACAQCKCGFGNFALGTFAKEQLPVGARRNTGKGPQ